MELITPRDKEYAEHVLAWMKRVTCLIWDRRHPEKAPLRQEVLERMQGVQTSIREMNREKIEACLLLEAEMEASDEETLDNG